MPRGGKRPGAGRKKKAMVPLTAIPAAIVDQATRMAAMGITPDRVLIELARIGFADLRQVVSWSGNVTEMSVNEDTGEMEMRANNQVRLIDSDKLTAEAAAAVAEVSQTKDGALKIKMHGKQPAPLALAKHLGLLQPPKLPADSDDAGKSHGDQGESSWSNLLQ